MVLPTLALSASGNPRPPPWIAAAASKVGKVALVVLIGMAVAPYLVPNVRWGLKSDITYRDTPMCDPSTGTCGEDPWVPSPRTVYSAKSKEQYDFWWEAHAKLNQSAAEYVHRRQRPQSSTTTTTAATTTTVKKPQLVLLGDSITEEWLGTNMGKYKKEWDGVPEVLQDLFVPNYDPLVLAIGGDQTQHLLWRLQHGELLEELAQEEDAVYVVLIGTNNIGSGALPMPTSRGVVAVAEYILQRTSTSTSTTKVGGRLILVQLLPRADNDRLKNICPPRCSNNEDKTPFASFMPAIQKVNEDLEKRALPKLRSTYGSDRIQLLNCGSDFILAHDETGADGASERIINVNEDLMPDRLHPNAKGHRLFSQCILDCLGGSC